MKKGKTLIHPLWSQKELFPQIKILMRISSSKISVSRKPYYIEECTAVKRKKKKKDRHQKKYKILQ